MNGIDYAVLCIVLISTVFGLWRGFAREAISLAVWVLAFWLAYTGAHLVEVWFNAWIIEKPLRLVAAFATIFLAVHIIGFFTARLSATLIKSVGLSGVDRVAGCGFGFIRGVVIVAVAVLLISQTPMADSVVWQQAYLVGLVEELLVMVEEYYPLSLTTHTDSI